MEYMNSSEREVIEEAKLRKEIQKTIGEFGVRDLEELKIILRNFNDIKAFLRLISKVGRGY